MRLLRRFPITVMTMVLISIVGVCAAGRSVKLLLVAFALTALSWYVTEGPRGRVLPRWVANLLVIAAALSVVVDLRFSPNDLAGVLGRFCVWLAIIKLYQRRTARDHAQLMALSLLLIIVGCLRTQELFFGIVLVLYAVTGLYALLLYQLYAAREGVIIAHRTAEAADGEVPPAPTTGRHSALHFRLLAIGIAVAGLSLSVALFVIFPRNVGHDLFTTSLWGHGGAARAGYTDEIDLDAGTRITDSPEVSFELELTDADGRPVRPAGPILLRGAVLDHYANGRWTAGGEARRVVETNAIAAARLGLVADRWLPGTIRQDYRFRNGTTTVFTMYLPVRIETSIPHRLAFVPLAQTLRGLDTGGLWSYAIESVPAPTDDMVAAIARTDPPPLVPAGGYRDGLDPAVPRVADLAGQLLARAGLAASATITEDRWAWNLAAAGAFRDYLRTGMFTYTIDLSDVVRHETDPIVNFLFKTRRGHCEYYASALAAMCHTVGIDARVVTGYVAREYDAEARRYVVRDAHAHAWVEVRSGSHRYSPVDPTPPSALPAGVGPPLDLADRLDWLYRRLEGSWASAVIGFDGRTQAHLLDTLDIGWSRRLGELGRSTRNWMARVNRAFYFGPAGYIWLGIVALAGVIALVAVIKIVRRYRRLRRGLGLQGMGAGESRRLLRQAGFYLDMLSVLERAGVPKPQWQPPLAFARGLRGRCPIGGDLVRKISSSYYKARYAGRRLSSDEVTRAEQRVRELATALGGRR